MTDNAETAAATRRSSKYQIVYKDGEIQEDLDKATALDLIEDDFEEKKILKVFKGFAVDYQVKPQPKATLDA